MDEETKTDLKGKEKRIDLSVPQVAGSALAAAVAAFLAGQLGVYGTIIGAGVVSVVATTGGSVFQHLFRRTGEQIKEATIVTRPRPRDSRTTRKGGPDAAATMVLPTFGRDGAPDVVTAVAAKPAVPVDNTRTQLLPRADAQPPTGGDAATRLLRPGADMPSDDATRALRAGRPAGATDRTQLVPRLDEHTVALGAAPPYGGPADGAETARFPGDETVTATYGTRLRGWRRPVLGAVGIFVLAMGAVTGVELITGETPSGSSGTTLGRLTHTGGSQRDTAPDDAPASPRPDHSHGTRDNGTPTGVPDPTTGPDGGSTPTPGGGVNGESSATTPAPTPSDGATPSSEPTTPEPTGPAGGKNGTSGDAGTGGQDTGGKTAAQEPDPNPS
ncbi:hypothetical protein [Streptomyces benahoarensis]|uniref:Uncharacterized protein n=1 Tax=Streptomyces benahoarensis TaxID=2595054 RepID=A0A553ZLV6_9ACTN|nr:hypothetical protein [Streptomyces benahoarensis]TSB26360.1 hypothetical protein FNJ62_11375 [Streptomyces benahoarensis]TSB42420.1 hypothetical protein FNZ23_10010 [Streptomyces benahoarensis]